MIIFSSTRPLENALKVRSVVETGTPKRVSPSNNAGANAWYHWNVSGRGILSNLPKAISPAAQPDKRVPVKITDAKPFKKNEASAVERVRSGLMDGLPWYSEERAILSNNPKKLMHRIRRLFNRAQLYESEWKILRGFISKIQKKWGNINNYFVNSKMVSYN